MQKRVMILDGYNILHQIPRWRQQLETSLEGGREQLLAYCSRWMRERGDVWLFVVVFDGAGASGTMQQPVGRGVRVIFSPSGQTADDRLLDMMHELGPRHVYTVVSDDRYVKDKARLHGAELMGSRQFAGYLAHRESIRQARAQGKSSGSGGGKTLPSNADSITESLRAIWGDA